MTTETKWSNPAIERILLAQVVIVTAPKPICEHSYGMFGRSEWMTKIECPHPLDQRKLQSSGADEFSPETCGRCGKVL
ncbi:MAG: hypothetical protein QM811_06900 [Pirellulales bacterium]